MSLPDPETLLFQAREEEAAALREELERWHRDAAGVAGSDGIGALGAAAVAGGAEGKLGTLHQQLRAAQEKEALLLEAYEQLERDQEKELAAGEFECGDLVWVGKSEFMSLYEPFGCWLLDLNLDLGS